MVEPNENDVIETVSKEEIYKDTMLHEIVVELNEFVENSKTEEVHVIKPVLQVYNQVQTDYESFKDLYVDNKEALEKIKILEDRVKLYGATIKKT